MRIECFIPITHVHFFKYIKSSYIILNINTDENKVFFFNRGLKNGDMDRNFSLRWEVGSETGKVLPYPSRPTWIEFLSLFCFISIGGGKFSPIRTAVLAQVGISYPIAISSLYY